MSARGRLVKRRIYSAVDKSKIKDKRKVKPKDKSWVKKGWRTKNRKGWCVQKTLAWYRSPQCHLESIQCGASDHTNGSDSDIFCPYHNSPNHTLNDCRVFRRISEDKRREFLRYHTICFRCCETPPHTFRKCSKEVKCAICQSTSHCSALHPD